MEVFRRIAEERIREAMEAGEFDNLSGRGKPIDISCGDLTPPDLRMPFKILRNAGMLPPEAELKKRDIQAFRGASVGPGRRVARR